MGAQLNCTVQSQKKIIRAINQGITKKASLDEIIVAFDNHTLLTYSIKHNYREAVELLIKNGANVNQINGKNFLPLTYAIHNGQVETVKLLINAGALCKMRDGTDHDAFAYAIKCNQVEILRLLMPHIGNVNQVNASGLTPIAYAQSLQNDTENNPGMSEIINILIAASTSSSSSSSSSKPLLKTSDLPSNSWFSTLCVLSALSIIGYDIYETNKLKKEEADDAVTEPFLILRNPSKETEKTVKENIDTKEIDEQETIEAVVITPKPVLQNSRQRPIKPVAHPTIEPEKTARFAFIKNLQKNLQDRIKPHYKAGKKQSKTWFTDLKQNPRQHKKLAASATLFTLALVKNWVPGLKDL